MFSRECSIVLSVLVSHIPRIACHPGDHECQNYTPSDGFTITSVDG
jgi:hypothetical protein